jgi:hypothetical protein
VPQPPPCCNHARRQRRKSQARTLPRSVFRSPRSAPASACSCASASRRAASTASDAARSASASRACCSAARTAGAAGASEHELVGGNVTAACFGTVPAMPRRAGGRPAHVHRCIEPRAPQARWLHAAAPDLEHRRALLRLSGEGLLRAPRRAARVQLLLQPGRHLRRAHAAALGLRERALRVGNLLRCLLRGWAGNVSGGAAAAAPCRSPVIGWPSDPPRRAAVRQTGNPPGVGGGGWGGQRTLRPAPRRVPRPRRQRPRSQAQQAAADARTCMSAPSRCAAAPRSAPSSAPSSASRAPAAASCRRREALSLLSASMRATRAARSSSKRLSTPSMSCQAGREDARSAAARSWSAPQHSAACRRPV